MSAAPAQGYLQDLGVLPGAASSYASAVDASGDVVVGNSSARAFRWTPAGGLESLLPSVSSSWAHGVSADGHTVVGTWYVGGARAFRWTANTGAQDLGLLPGWSRADALDVSADGSVVVGQLSNIGGQSIAFRWTAAMGMQDLGTPPGGASFLGAVAVSDDGSVVVGNAWVLGLKSFVWTAATGMRLLDTYPSSGYEPSVADLSGDGRVAVGLASPLSYAPDVAVRWDLATNTMQILPLPGTTWSYAYKTNRDGSVVVGTGIGFLGSSWSPFHLSTTGGLTALGTLGGATAEARGVNAAGSIVVGWSYTTGGAQHAFRFDFDSLGSPFCAAVPNSTGATGHIAATGSRVVTTNFFTLSAERLPLNVIGFFLTSMMPGDIFPVAGSQGRLCLAGNIGRCVGPGQIQSSGATGSFQLRIDLTWMPTSSGSVAVGASETWNFQAWHRDMTAGAVTSNFTDAVRVNFE